MTLIELMQSVTIMVLAVGLILNAMATRHLIKAVRNCTELTMMAILFQR